MKKTIMYDVNGGKIQKEIDYIPVRYILAIFITVLEVLWLLYAIMCRTFILLAGQQRFFV